MQLLLLLPPPPSALPKLCAARSQCYLILNSRVVFALQWSSSTLSRSSSKIFYKLLISASSMITDSSTEPHTGFSSPYFHRFSPPACTLLSRLDSKPPPRIMWCFAVCVNTRARTIRSVHLFRANSPNCGTFRVLDDDFFSVVASCFIFSASTQASSSTGSPKQTILCDRTRVWVRNAIFLAFVEPYYSFATFANVFVLIIYNLFLPSIYLLRDMGILWAALRLINFLFPILLFTVVR